MGLKKSYEIDMCNGPLLSRILLFSFPLICSGVLQLLFNAADIIIVGRSTGSNSMAAVGATTSLIGLLVNFFIGISVGANVLIQSSINSFGATVVTGNTAASNIESFVYISMNAIYQTALSFTSQNFGARQFRRVDQILIRCMVLVFLLGLILGNGAYLLGKPLLSI